jgi:Ca2+-binding RTX toxin-like protein
MSGGSDNDTYIVDNAGDVVTEAAGSGALDRVKTSTTYSLDVGSEVEVLETTSPGGTTAIDLVGNEFNNTIIGNAGSNVDILLNTDADADAEGVIRVIGEHVVDAGWLIL